MGEAPGHHGGEEGEADRVEVGGRDVPALEGSAVGPPALRPPRAGQVQAEALDHPLGLLVGVLFDVATVRGDGDEVGLGAIVVEPLDQFAGIAGVLVAQLLIDNLGVEDALELLLRQEPSPATETHAHDGVRSLVQQLAHRVEGELVVAMDPHLLTQLAAERHEHSRRRRTVLPAGLEVRLGVQRLLHECRCCGHAIFLRSRAVRIPEFGDRVEIHRSANCAAGGIRTDRTRHLVGKVTFDGAARRVRTATNDLGGRGPTRIAAPKPVPFTVGRSFGSAERETVGSVVQGKVKFFDQDRGFGFISREGGEDVFVHVSNLQAGGTSLAEGQAVEFEVGPGRKSEEAKNVRSV